MKKSPVREYKSVQGKPHNNVVSLRNMMNLNIIDLLFQRLALS